MSAVIESVKTFFETHSDLGPTGVVAVSGGADSVALLRALIELDRFKLIVAHVNHQLRGDESDGDEAFVWDLAATYKLVFDSTRVVIPPGENLEAAARKLRYEWFAQMGVSHHARWVATGHTADDQAETVLFRILRGTGLKGLRGIYNDHQIDFLFAHVGSPMTLIRPMLEVPREAVQSYLSVLQQTFRSDSSNDELRYTRNRIRHEIVPLLKSINPHFVTNLNRLSHQADLADEYFEDQAMALLESCTKPNSGAVFILDSDRIDEEPSILIRSEMFRILWGLRRWPLGDMTFDHWQRLADLVEGDYPGGIRLKRVGTVVQLGPRS